MRYMPRAEARLIPRGRLGQGPLPGMVPAGSVTPDHPASAEWNEYYVYTFDFAGANAITAGTANALPNAALARTEINIRTDSDTIFEILSWIYVATDPRVYVRVRDDRAGRYLHLGTLDLRANSGQGAIGLSIGSSPAFFPYRLRRPWQLAPLSLLTVSAQDFSGATNTMRWSLHGVKRRVGAAPWEVDPWSGQVRRIVEEVPFVYPLPDDNTNYNLTANQSITFALQTDSDSDFLCDGITGIRDGAATIFLQDGVDRQRRWMDRAAHIDNLVGNGSNPNFFPAPRWVGARSVVQATFADLSGLANQVRVYLHGRKVYYA